MCITVYLDSQSCDVRCMLYGNIMNLLVQSKHAFLCTCYNNMLQITIDVKVICQECMTKKKSESPVGI